MQVDSYWNNPLLIHRQPHIIHTAVDNMRLCARIGLRFELSAPSLA